MITGDHPATAQSVARQLNLASGGMLTGAEMDSMDEPALRARIGAIGVFARVAPEQKLRIVNAFKANGEIVAMTGDGVNDAPALKSANIGIAMGARGTDVARESADLVLLDDDFSSIVKAVRSGRRIYDNIKKAMMYIFAVHVPIAGMSLLPALFNWPLVLLPLHIGFLELIIDPACSVVFEAEPEEPDVMNRPPRKADEQLFGRSSVGASLLQGLGVLLIAAFLFRRVLSNGGGDRLARTLTFAVLTIGNLALIWTNRSRSRATLASLRSPNPALWWISGGALASLAVVIYSPALQSLFAFAPLGRGELGLCLASAAISVIWFEAIKRLMFR